MSDDERDAVVDAVAREIASERAAEVEALRKRAEEAEIERDYWKTEAIELTSQWPDAAEVEARVQAAGDQRAAEAVDLDQLLAAMQPRLDEADAEWVVRTLFSPLIEGSVVARVERVLRIWEGPEHEDCGCTRRTLTVAIRNALASPAPALDAEEGQR